jgi:hypothetical protein
MEGLMTVKGSTLIAERKDRWMGNNPGRKTRGYRKDEFPAHAIDRLAGPSRPTPAKPAMSLESKLHHKREESANQDPLTRLLTETGRRAG